mgnify:FL=1
MFPYNESEWEFISVIKDNRYKIKMTVEDLNEEGSSEDLPDTPDAEPIERHKKSVEKIKESLEA